MYKEREVLFHEIEELENIIENYEIEVERMKNDIVKLRKENNDKEFKIKDKDKTIECLNLLTGDLNLDLMQLEEKLERSSNSSDLPIEYRISYDEVAVDDTTKEHWVDIRNEFGKVVARVNVDRILIQKPKYYQRVESNGGYEYRPEQGYAAMSCMPLEVVVDSYCNGLRSEWAFTGFKCDYVNDKNPGLNEIGNILYKPAYYYNEYFKVLTNSVVVGKGQANRVLFKIEKEVNDKDVIWNYSGELVYDNSFKRFILFFIDGEVSELEKLKYPLVKSLKWGIQGEFFKLSNYMNLVVKRVRKCYRKDNIDEYYDLYLNLTVQKCNRFSSYKNCEHTIEAAKQNNSKIITIAGGVASNSRLREKMTEMAGKENISVLYPPPVLCTDNAAMIACAGYFAYENGERAGLNLNAIPSLQL